VFTFKLCEPSPCERKGSQFISHEEDKKQANVQAFVFEWKPTDYSESSIDATSNGNDHQVVMNTDINLQRVDTSINLAIAEDDDETPIPDFSASAETNLIYGAYDFKKARIEKTDVSGERLLLE